MTNVDNNEFENNKKPKSNCGKKGSKDHVESSQMIKRRQTISITKRCIPYLRSQE